MDIIHRFCQNSAVSVSSQDSLEEQHLAVGHQ